MIEEKNCHACSIFFKETSGGTIGTSSLLKFFKLRTALGVYTALDYIDILKKIKRLLGIR